MTYRHEGAREDLAIWKRRALEAENLLRIERETSARLVAELNAQSGPVRFGEPAPQASAAATALRSALSLLERTASECWRIGERKTDEWDALGATLGIARGVLKSAPPAAVDSAKGADAALDAVRQRLCKLQRYSFLIGPNGGVRRVKDRVGNWIEFDAAHELLDPVAVDAAVSALAAQPAASAEPVIKLEPKHPDDGEAGNA